MKTLITGANGQLGRELQKRLKGTEVIATGFKELDIVDEGAVSNILHKHNPDVIIHCAAYTNVDAAEERCDFAYRVNAIGTKNIAKACQVCGAKMVYISTDYVFDGKLGRAYTEFDAPNPLSVYGKSKHAGEVLARQATDKLFVVRTAWLYGDGTNFVQTMLKLGKECDEIQVVNDQYGCPTSAVDLAEAVLRLIQTNKYGTYHMVNLGVTTWYGFAKKIFQLIGNTNVIVKPVTTKQFARLAPRPAYSPMDTRLLRLTLDWSPRYWEQALQSYLEAKSRWD